MASARPPVLPLNSLEADLLELQPFHFRNDGHHAVDPPRSETTPASSLERATRPALLGTEQDASQDEHAIKERQEGSEDSHIGGDDTGKNFDRDISSTAPENQQQKQQESRHLRLSPPEYDISGHQISPDAGRERHSNQGQSPMTQSHAMGGAYWTRSVWREGVTRDQLPSGGKLLATWGGRPIAPMAGALMTPKVDNRSK